MNHEILCSEKVHHICVKTNIKIDLWNRIKVIVNSLDMRTIVFQCNWNSWSCCRVLCISLSTSDTKFSLTNPYHFTFCLSIRSLQIGVCTNWASKKNNVFQIIKHKTRSIKFLINTHFHYVTWNSSVFYYVIVHNTDKFCA